MKTWRRHGCTAIHHDGHDFMACAIPGAQITGDGTVAVIAWCHSPRASLHTTPSAADDRLAAIDRLGCLADGCQGRHEVIHVRLGA